MQSTDDARKQVNACSHHLKRQETDSLGRLRLVHPVPLGLASRTRWGSASTLQFAPSKNGFMQANRMTFINAHFSYVSHPDGMAAVACAHAVCAGHLCRLCACEDEMHASLNQPEQKLLYHKPRALRIKAVHKAACRTA